MNESFFHWFFIFISVTVFIIRVRYHRLAARSRGRTEFKEGKRLHLLRLIIGLPFMLLLIAYMMKPQILAWANLPFPITVRFLGLLLCLVSIPLIWWVHHSLESNFSTTLHVREKHTLITHGPYRWIRHPMYTILFIHIIGILMLTTNWLIGGVLLFALILIVGHRIMNEEKLMIEKFGDEYNSYMRCTGRFLPRIHFRIQRPE